MIVPYPLTFQPAFKSRIWGGTKLIEWFEDCPTEMPIGEAWVLSDHKEGPSPIANGPYAGKELRQLMALEPSWFQSLAEQMTPEGRFPLLFKVIDAADDLSVQVHPNDEYGFAHSGEQGKTECWWVLRADEGSKIIYGHTATDRTDLRHKVQSGEWDSLLKSVAPKQGDFFFVPSGKLHALGKGTMVLEVQQSSDTTYRVFDYNRLDKDGQPRTLHLEDAMAVTLCPDEEIQTHRKSVERPWHAEELVACPYFQVEHWTMPSGIMFQPQQLLVLSVLEGTGELSGGTSTCSFKPGTQILLPEGLKDVRLSASTSVQLLSTAFPSRSS